MATLAPKEQPKQDSGLGDLLNFDAPTTNNNGFNNGAFGGNIRFIGSGSAPLSPELGEFLKVTMALVVGEGYGLTETSTAGTATESYDNTYGHVGAVGMSVEMKLVDVEDMNYTLNDEPLPRGIYV